MSNKSFEPLDEHAFYETYFRARGVPADIVLKVRHILEDELNADLSRLAAKDDFQGLLIRVHLEEGHDNSCQVCIGV